MSNDIVIFCICCVLASIISVVLTGYLAYKNYYLCRFIEEIKNSYAETYENFVNDVMNKDNQFMDKVREDYSSLYDKLNDRWAETLNGINIDWCGIEKEIENDK